MSTCIWIKYLEGRWSLTHGHVRIFWDTLTQARNYGELLKRGRRVF